MSPVEALSEYAGRGSRATRGQHGAKQGPKVEMAPGRFFVSLLAGRVWLPGTAANSGLLNMEYLLKLHLTMTFSFFPPQIGVFFNTLRLQEMAQLT